MRALGNNLWHMLKKKQKYRYDPPIKKHEEFEALRATEAAVETKRTEGCVVWGHPPNPRRI